jgi:hypothetical protein
MSGTFWHSDHKFIQTSKSYLTDREICSNLHPDKFLVPTTWTPLALKRAIDELFPLWHSSDMKSYHKPSIQMWLLLTPFEKVDRVDQFGAALDHFFENREHWGREAREEGAWTRGGWRVTDKTRAIELLHAIWRQDAIAWPVVSNPFRRQNYMRTHLFGRTEPIIAAFMSATFSHSRSFMRGAIVPLLLKRIGIHEVGDLTGAVVSGGLTDTYAASFHMVAARALLVIQRATYGQDRITESPEDFSRLPDDEAKEQPVHRIPKAGSRAYNKRSLNTFEWVIAENPKLITWREYGLAWLEEASRAKGHCIGALNGFFKHLITTPNVPTDPKDYFNIRTKLESLYAPGNRQNYQTTAAFFDWILDCRLSDEIEGIPLRPPDLRNPLTKTAMPRIRYAESVREALPNLFVQMLLEILTEDDWAWARAYAQTAKQGGDWFICANKATGEFLQRWSPVRAVAIWLKLRMPFRTFQVRMLDSGEADTLVYDPNTCAMNPNKGPLHMGTQKHPIQKGVLQMRQDQRVARSVPILRINTNKTADIDKTTDNHGYDCPYAPADVMKMLAWLRDWQIEFNPIIRPTPWDEVTELVKVRTPLQVRNHTSCFLFRNPVGSASPAHPIAGAWISKMWAHLLLELETRLTARGMLGPDGAPHKLVDVGYHDGRVRYSPRYDLHSLRVTFITAFYEAGVPPEILMKIVGHATIVMTLYYIKFGTASISEQMEAGQERILRQTQENWVRHQKTLDLKTLRSGVAWNEDVGPAYFAESYPGSLVFMDIGICPVGRSKCDIGGPKLTGDGTRTNDYAPVPGVRTNCAACRFIISGPPFLHGLVAHFNAKSQAASARSARRSILDREFEELDAERRSAVAAGEPFLRHREWQKAATDLDEITDTVDQLLLQMNALARLIEQSRRILVEEGDRDRTLTALVANDISMLETVFEETTEFDLLDRICQSSTFFGSVDPTNANIGRMRAYDRMLVKNGLQPAFLDMDEETSLRVGNQLSRLFTARAGRANTLNLLDGKETLARLGFDIPDLSNEMSAIARRRIHLRPRVVDLLEADQPTDAETA